MMKTTTPIIPHCCCTTTNSWWRLQLPSSLTAAAQQLTHDEDYNSQFVSETASVTNIMLKILEWKNHVVLLQLVSHSSSSSSELCSLLHRLYPGCGCLCLTPPLHHQSSAAFFIDCILAVAACVSLLLFIIRALQPSSSTVSWLWPLLSSLLSSPPFSFLSDLFTWNTKRRD